jgi:hypothetical protein
VSGAPVVSSAAAHWLPAWQPAATQHAAAARKRHPQVQCRRVWAHLRRQWGGRH